MSSTHKLQWGMVPYLQGDKPGLCFCRGEKYFCQDSGKTCKNHGKNWQKLAISTEH